MKIPFPLLLLAVSLVACKSPKGETVAEKRQAVLDVRNKTVAELQRREPATKSELKEAAGYAVFNNLETQFLITRTGHGYGCVTDNETQKVTYMHMAQLGGGLGFKISDLRVVFVFRNKDVMQKFVESGWEFGLEAGGGAEVDDTGGTADAAGSFKEGIRIYRLTGTGVTLQTALTGTKYWKDDDLN